MYTPDRAGFLGRSSPWWLARLGADLGFSGWRGLVTDYVVPWRWLTPSRSRACFWRGVGVVTSRKAGRAGSAGWIWLRQMVARSPSRVAKLCTGRSPAVRLVPWSVPAFLDTGLGCQLTELPIS
jgi:hypothetical protein